MRDHEAVILRREFAARERGRGKRYPTALRERATRWIRTQTAAGTSLRAVARALGIHTESARRWNRSDAAELTSTALVPIEIVVDEVRPARALTVISPAGFRVDGLSLVEAAALMREIG